MIPSYLRTRKGIKSTRSSKGDFFFEDVTELSKWYQAAYVPKRGSSQHVVQKGMVIFEDVTELNKWYQAAYIPERRSSQHVVQKEIFFLKMWLNLVNDTKLPTYPKGDQVNT